MSQFVREELLIGEEAVARLKRAKTAVYGIGGVGSFACEALARAGVGHLVLLDNDTIDITNLNRQIHALHSTVGRYKVEVMKERILAINPEAVVEIYRPSEVEIGEENLLDSSFDYVIDAVDTMKIKIELAVKADELKIPIIAAMGAGNKLDPTRFEVSTIEKTSVCPLARVMRKELGKRGIKKLKVVYSKEEPRRREAIPGERKQAPGSISFVPSVVGLIIAGEVIKDIIENK